MLPKDYVNCDCSYSYILVVCRCRVCRFRACWLRVEGLGLGLRLLQSGQWAESVVAGKALAANGEMDPYSSPYIIPNTSLHNPFPHPLLRTRQRSPHFQHGVAVMQWRSKRKEPVKPADRKEACNLPKKSNHQDHESKTCAVQRDHAEILQLSGIFLQVLLEVKG